MQMSERGGTCSERNTLARIAPFGQADLENANLKNTGEPRKKTK
jgi:hypothetical protein